MEENTLATKPDQNQELNDLLSELTLAERLKFFNSLNKKDTDIYGDGVKEILKSLKNKREGISLAFKGNRMNFPPSSRAVLEKYGDKPIDLSSIRVCRKPLEAVLQKVIKGVVRTKLPYDKIFHLSIRFKIEGKIVRADKRETLQIAQDDDMVDTECISVQPSSKTPKTLNEILENTRKLMGDNKFYTYSATSNNCQIFILNVMKANGITGNVDFIKQNVNELIPSFLGKIADLGTDIKSRLGLITEGKGLGKGVHALSMSEINEYYNGKGFYQGTYMSNALPKKINDGSAMIINLEDIETKGGGTHWVCCIRKDNTNFYFDSYGIPCDDDVLQMFANTGGKSVYNDKQLQKIDSITCGYFCLYVIDKCLEEGRPLNKVLKTMNNINKNEIDVVANSKKK
jgi:hypothetical protein